MSASSPDAWDARARRLLEGGADPHYAPDADELALYRRTLEPWCAHAERSAATPRLLVLGATPELADLGLELGFDVVRVDASPTMFEAARLRERVEDRGREQCLVADWRNLESLDTDSVHAVVGDAALNNVDHADMESVLEELQRVLPVGGILSLKQIVLPTTAGDRLELEPVLRARRAGELDDRTFRMLVRFWCFRRPALDPSRHVLDAAAVYRAVDEEREKGTWTDEEYALLLASRSDLRHTVYAAPTQKALFMRFFGSCRTEHASPALHHQLFFVHHVARNARRWATAR